MVAEARERHDSAEKERLSRGSTPASIVSFWSASVFGTTTASWPQSRLGELEVLLVMEPYLVSRFLDRPNKKQNDLQYFSKLYRELFWSLNLFKVSSHNSLTFVHINCIVWWVYKKVYHVCDVDGFVSLVLIWLVNLGSLRSLKFAYHQSKTSIYVSEDDCYKNI